MRYNTFLITGVEVLQLGGQRWESNAWPSEHWRKNKGRWRIFTVPLDEYITRDLRSKDYGGGVEGCVVALEIADFKKWSDTTFTKPNTSPSFKRKHRDMWFFAKLDWMDIQYLTLRRQYSAMSAAVLASVALALTAKRMPKGFHASAFADDLADVLKRGKPSAFTRAAYGAGSA